MKDITNGVSAVILLMVAAFLWRANVNTADENQSSRSGTPRYAYNGTQEVKRQKIKPSAKQRSKQCHNRTALHEAAHFVVYMELCKQHGITPKPVELSIVPDEKNLGHFLYLPNNAIKEVNILTYLAGYAMNEYKNQNSHSEIMEDYATQEGSDIELALRILSQRQFDGYFQQALRLVESLEPQIQEVAIRLEKEKIIKF